MSNLPSTSTTPQCDFDQVGVFHFKIEFYVDENFTVLQFTDTSQDNPAHFLIDNQPFPSDGFTTQISTCYALSYKPNRGFLISNNLVNQVFYTKAEANLVRFIDQEE